eukprot:8875877-Alexandrium_andersonii.AAC.1
MMASSSPSGSPWFGLKSATRNEELGVVGTGGPAASGTSTSFNFKRMGTPVAARAAFSSAWRVASVPSAASTKRQSWSGGPGRISASASAHSFAPRP